MGHKKETLPIKYNWQRNLVYWSAAILVGLVAVAFAELADLAGYFRARFIRYNPLFMIGILPFGLMFSSWVTCRWFTGAKGSGIPQVISCTYFKNNVVTNSILSLKNACAKIILTCIGLLCGASIGREGPTVQIGASIMNNAGLFSGLKDPDKKSALVKAGGAAGVAAAFNTPLGGIVFGIEELAHSFTQRISNTMLTCVVISGVTAIALTGNYTYFGHTFSSLPFGTGWLAVFICGIVGGISGGLFSAMTILFSTNKPSFLRQFTKQHPVIFAGICGLVLAIIGISCHGMIYGTGYTQAKEIIMGSDQYPATYFLLKLLATFVSFCSGVPGGLFAPSLSIGAGMGGWIAQFIPIASPGAVVLLGTVAYFSAVTQSPLTATVIVMEMCDNQQITLPLLASAFLAFGISRLICKHPLYGTLSTYFTDAIRAQRRKRD